MQRHKEHVPAALVRAEEVQQQQHGLQLFQVLQGCFQDAYRIRDTLQEQAATKGYEPATVKLLLNTVDSLRRLTETSANVVALALEQQRRGEEQAQATDTEAELRDLVAEALPEAVLRQGIEEALAGPFGAEVAAGVAEVLAPVLGPWLVARFTEEGEGGTD